MSYDFAAQSIQLVGEMALNRDDEYDIAEAALLAAYQSGYRDAADFLDAEAQREGNDAAGYTLRAAAHALLAEAAIVALKENSPFTREV
jgi:hypothetical protein